MGGEGLHEWAFATRAFGALHGSDGDVPTSTTGSPAAVHVRLAKV